MRGAGEIVGIARTKPQDFPGDFFLCDLINEKEAEALITTLLTHFQIDALINNLGAGGPQPLGSIDFNTLRSLYDINVRTAVQMTQGLLAQMKERQWGRIVNPASRAIFGVPGRTSYAATKSAIVGCTRAWTLELAVFGITVNAVAPGPIETPTFRAIRPLGRAAEKELLDQIPMGRIGKPTEVAAAVEFLLSDDAAFITGQTICSDGGGSL